MAAPHPFHIDDGMASTDVDVSAVIANGGITKNGSGTLLFSGGSQYLHRHDDRQRRPTGARQIGPNGSILGDLIIGDGMGTGTDQVIIGAANQIANTANVTINDGAELTCWPMRTALACSR